MLRTPSAPGYWDANFVRVEGDASMLDGPALVRAGDALLAASHHRKFEIEDEVAGARLRSFFEVVGWIVDRNAMMHRAGPAAGPRRRRGGLAGRHAAPARRVVPRLRRRSRRPGGARRHAGPDRRAARDARLHRARRERTARRVRDGGRARRRGRDRDRPALRDAGRAWARDRRPARRGRDRRRRSRRRVGRRRRRRPGASALRAARVRDRVAAPRGHPAPSPKIRRPPAKSVAARW